MSLVTFNTESKRKKDRKKNRFIYNIKIRIERKRESVYACMRYIGT